jgi:hypothetical protein
MQKKSQVCNHNLEACGVLVLFDKGITTLWEFVVCLKRKLMEWHNQAYLYGQCPNCGVDKKLSFCSIELASIRFIFVATYKIKNVFIFNII